MYVCQDIDTSTYKSILLLHIMMDCIKNNNVGGALTLFEAQNKNLLHDNLWTKWLKSTSNTVMWFEIKHPTAQPTSSEQAEQFYTIDPYKEQWRLMMRAQPPSVFQCDALGHSPTP